MVSQKTVCGSDGLAPTPLRHALVHLEGRLIGGRREAAFDALLHARKEDAVTEALPALLRVVHGNDRPTAGGRAGGMEDLTLGGIKNAVSYLNIRGQSFDQH